MTTPGSVEAMPTAGLEGSEAVRETQEAPRDITPREQVDGLVGQIDNSLNQHRESGERSVGNIASIGTNLDGDPQDIANLQDEVKKVGLDGEASAKVSLINNLRQIQNQSQPSGENPYGNDEVHPDVNWDDHSGEIDEGDRSLASDDEGEESKSNNSDEELRELLEGIFQADRVDSTDAEPTGSDSDGEDDPDSSEKEKTREEVEELADALVAASPYMGERKEGGSVFLPNDENTDRFVELLKKVMDLEAEGKIDYNVTLLPRPATLDIGTKFRAFYDESSIVEGSDGKLTVNFTGHIEVENEPDPEAATSSETQPKRQFKGTGETEEMFAERVRKFNALLQERKERDDFAIRSITASLEKASVALENINSEASNDPEKQNLLKLGPSLKLLNESFGSKSEIAKELLSYVRDSAKEMDGSTSGATPSDVSMAQKLILNRERAKDLRFKEALGKIGALDTASSPDGDNKAGSESLANLLSYLAKNSEGILDGDSKQNNEPEDAPVKSDDSGAAEPENAGAVSSEAGKATVEDGVAEQNIDKEMADVAGGEQPTIEADGSTTTVKTDADGGSSENPYSDPEVYSDVNWDDDSDEVDVADKEIAQSNHSTSMENKTDSSS